LATESQSHRDVERRRKRKREKKRRRGIYLFTSLWLCGSVVKLGIEGSGYEIIRE
jgi:hypothetical protein